MPSLEKLSEQEFDKLYNQYLSTNPDSTSDFYQSITRVVVDIKSMQIDTSIKEELYAQAIETIYRNNDFQKMGDALSKVFESFATVYSSIFKTAEEVHKYTTQIREDAGKIKWYQGETQQEIDKAKKGLEYLAQQQDKIQKQNEMTKKRLDDVQKNIEERDKYHPN